MVERSRAARRIPPLLLLLCLASGCLGPPPLPPPLRVPMTEFDTIGTLCLLALESEAPTTPETARRLENQIADGLRALGFESVDSEKTVEALTRLGRAAGGYYDVDNGRRDDARYAQLAPKVRRGAGKALGCQALLEPRVVVVSAPWGAGVARWDGNAVGIGGGRSATGTIGALSLHLRIADADDRELYYGVGGIEPIARLNETFFESHFEALDAESFLQSEAANRKAIQIALAELPRRTPARR